MEKGFCCPSRYFKLIVKNLIQDAPEPNKSKTSKPTHDETIYHQQEAQEPQIYQNRTFQGTDSNTFHMLLENEYFEYQHLSVKPIH